MSELNPSEVIELYRNVDEYNSEFNHNTSDKMQLLGLGELPSPASCFVCGSGTNDSGYVNLGIWAEFIGNLLVCATCLTQAAELVGCLAPSVKDLLSRNMESLQQHSKGLEKELASVREQLDASNTLLGSYLTIGRADLVVGKNDNEDAGETTNGEGLEDPDADEPIVSEGPLPIPEPATLDDPAPIRL